LVARKPTVVPLNFRAQVKADIEADVMKGILERVPVVELDLCCSRIVIQEKKNGKARRTVNLSYLSKRGLAESHHTPSAAIIAIRCSSPHWTVSMVTMGLILKRLTETKLLPQRNGEISTTGEPLKDTYQQVTVTPDTQTPSWRIVRLQHLTETLRR
jgi:hypothetical protein